MAEREAFLKMEYASWYPAIPAGEWIGAHTAQYLVGFQLKYGEPRWKARAGSSTRITSSSEEATQAGNGRATGGGPRG